MENKNSEKHSADFWKADKFIFGTIIILGYMVGWLITGFVGMTAEQAQLFAQGLATLGPVVGMIAASIWKFAKDELEDRKNLSQTITTLADKAPPVTVPIEDLTPKEYLDEPSNLVPPEGPADGSVDAPWFGEPATPSDAST